jgi:hypothetical protein
MNNKRDLIFISDHDLGHHPITRKPYSSGASTRYRSINPALALSRYGIQSHLFSTKYDKRIDRFIHFEKETVFILGKLFSSESTELACQLGRNGYRLVLDLCDNYLEGGLLFDIYERLINIADCILVNTAEMHSRVTRFGLSVPIYLIPDLTDASPKPFRQIEDQNRLRSLVFGHKTVCESLSRWLANLNSFPTTERLLIIELVTNIDADVLKWYDVVSKKYNSLIITLTQWTEIAVEHAADRSDLVLIPGGNDAFYQTKSTNRLVDSVIFGLPVVAFPYPSYKKYDRYFPITDNPKEGLLSLLNDREIWTNRWNDGRSLIEIEYSESTIGQRWKTMVDSVNNQTPRNPVDLSLTNNKIRNLDRRFIFSSQEIVFGKGVELVIDSQLENETYGKRGHAILNCALRVLTKMRTGGIPQLLTTYMAENSQQVTMKNYEVKEFHPTWEFRGAVNVKQAFLERAKNKGELRPLLHISSELLYSRVMSEFEIMSLLCFGSQVLEPFLGRFYGPTWFDVMSRVEEIWNTLNRLTISSESPRPDQWTDLKLQCIESIYYILLLDGVKGSPAQFSSFELQHTPD